MCRQCFNNINLLFFRLTISQDPFGRVVGNVDMASTRYGEVVAEACGIVLQDLEHGGEPVVAVEDVSSPSFFGVRGGEVGGVDHAHKRDRKRVLRPVPCCLETAFDDRDVSLV